MSTAVIVLNIAYLALLASTFTRTVTWLRYMLILAAIAFIVFGFVEDIMSMVLWNVAIGGMHLFRVVRDHHQQRSITLTPAEQIERDQFFPNLSDFDFHLLWAMGSEVAYDGHVLVRPDEIPETVSLVLHGVVVVEDGQGALLRGLRRGALVGEMSFVSGAPADVEVRAQGAVVLKQWEQRQLAALDQLHPSSARAFRELVSRDLVMKARVATPDR